MIAAKRYRNLIDGEWVDPHSGETFTRENPATGEAVGIISQSDREDVKAAVDAARVAFDQGIWSADGKERGKAMNKLVAVIQGEAERLAKLLTMHRGMTLHTSQSEMAATAETLGHYAGLATMLGGETYNSNSTYMHVILKEPVGVCGLITPFNFPIDLLMRKLAPALAAGCTVVIKPSEYTAGITQEFLELVARVPEIPRGVINSITGSRRVVGQEVVRNPNVDKISFTGGTETGKAIMSDCAGSLKKLSLECGGDAPNIIFEDADLPRAVPIARDQMFYGSGQSCTAFARLIVQRSIHDRFVKEVVEETKKLKVGNGLDPSVDLGAVVSAERMKRVLEYIEAGNQMGAKLVCGGKRLTTGDLSKGYFIEPTIFDGVTSDMRIAQEEIFGPVLSILTFDDEAEAIRIANDTVYGLSSSVWTKDVTRAIRVARSIKAGETWINAKTKRTREHPFGGYKQSGLGRELGGLIGLDEYLETKHVGLDLSR